MAPAPVRFQRRSGGNCQLGTVLWGLVNLHMRAHGLFQYPRWATALEAGGLRPSRGQISPRSRASGWRYPHWTSRLRRTIDCRHPDARFCEGRVALHQVLRLGSRRQMAPGGFGAPPQATGAVPELGGRRPAITEPADRPHRQCYRHRQSGPASTNQLLTASQRAAQTTKPQLG